MFMNNIVVLIRAFRYEKIFDFARRPQPYKETPQVFIISVAYKDLQIENAGDIAW